MAHQTWNIYSSTSLATRQFTQPPIMYNQNATTAIVMTRLSARRLSRLHKRADCSSDLN